MGVMGTGEDEAAGAACLKADNPGQTSTSRGLATVVPCTAVLLTTVVL